MTALGLCAHVARLHCGSAATSPSIETGTRRVLAQQGCDDGGTELRIAADGRGLKMFTAIA